MSLAILALVLCGNTHVDLVVDNKPGRPTLDLMEKVYGEWTPSPGAAERHTTAANINTFFASCKDADYRFILTVFGSAQPLTKGRPPCSIQCTCHVNDNTP